MSSQFLYSLFPSRTIARYMARMFLLRTFAVLGGLVLILQTLDLLGESGKILAVAGNGEAELWRYVMLRLPQLIALFLPFSVLLAALMTFMTLNQNSEIVIFKASGISSHQILMPLILSALLVAGVNFAFNEGVLVHANARLDRWEAAEYHPLSPQDISSREVWVRAGNDLIHARNVEGEGAATELSDVTIFKRAQDHLVDIVLGRKAVPVENGWRLVDVRAFNIESGRTSTADAQIIATAATPQQFTTQGVNADHLPLWELVPAIFALKDAGRPTDALVASAYHKISGPLSAVLMPLLGAVAAFGLARAGRLFIRGVIGLALGFAFFVADNFAMAMADFGVYPAWAAAFAPFILFFLVGEALLYHSEE